MIFTRLSFAIHPPLNFESPGMRLVREPGDEASLWFIGV